MNALVVNALVVYDSEYGNTERIAQAIADAGRAFGLVRIAHVTLTQPIELQGVDTLIVGCPTQGWRPTPALQAWLDQVAADRLPGLTVACFDTRFQLPRWLTGSAAGVLARQLQALGASLCVPPESFFVTGRHGPLQHGELERAATWARHLFTAAAAAQPAGRR